jgi:hypothetical protein
MLCRFRPVDSTDGTIYERRLRSNARIGVCCVISYPTKVSDIGADRQMVIERIAPWQDDALRFVEQEFQTPAKFTVLNLDELYPHIDCFVAGPPRHIHPGIRAECEHGHRLTDGKERVKRHRRAGYKRRLQRVPSRAAYLALSLAARVLERHTDPEAREALVMMNRPRHGP